MNIPKDLATSFFETTPVAAFDYVLVPGFLEKKVSRDIAFEFISLFHVQIQEPASMSDITRAFVFLAKFAEFYYHTIF